MAGRQRAFLPSPKRLTPYQLVHERMVGFEFRQMRRREKRLLDNARHEADARAQRAALAAAVTPAEPRQLTMFEKWAIEKLRS
jgi:hypothetical protein